MIRKLLTILCFVLIAQPAIAQTAYIDDTLLVPLRSGAGTSFRIIHKGLRSGLKLEVLEQDSTTGYSKIRTPGGLEGFLPTRYLSKSPIARLQLANTLEKLKRVEAQNANLTQELANSQSALTNANSELENTSKNLSSNIAELENIKSISANALHLDKKNRELRESNEQLRNELELLQVENIRLKDRSESNMMLIGGGLVTLGVILALLIPMLKPSKKNDSWA